MIFFESNKKIFWVILFAVVVTGFIFSEWLRRDPFGHIDTNGDKFWVNIFDAGNQTATNIQTSVQLGVDNVKNIADEATKEEQQAQLVAAAKKYVADKENIDVASWDTYKNDIYSFSIAIPTGYRSRAVYDDIDIPLTPDLMGFYLVNGTQSISMSTESRALYKEEGDLSDILAQRAKEYDYKTININDIIFYQNDTFPENGQTIFTALDDKVLIFTFRNVDQSVVDAMIHTFKFTN